MRWMLESEGVSEVLVSSQKVCVVNLGVAKWVEGDGIIWFFIRFVIALWL